MKQATGFRRYFGLMFRTSRTKPLVFYFNKPTLISIHSLFVFFKFTAIWFDECNKVIEARVVKPFSFNIKPKKPFCKLVELPIHSSWTIH